MDDFDTMFQPYFLNYMRLLNALDDLGVDTSRFREEAHPFSKSSFFRFKPEGYTLDFWPRVGGELLFSSCYHRRLVSAVDETEISVIALEDLVVCKKAAGRKKDLEDIKLLEALHKRLLHLEL